MKTKEAPRVVRVSLDEFELEDGRIFPLPFELEEEMSPEEFQVHYSKWWGIIMGMYDSDV
jgi:hypothetical protein